LQYAAAMGQLLAEWDLVGHTAEDVEFAIGSPSELKRDRLVHRFEDGLGVGLMGMLPERGEGCLDREARPGMTGPDSGDTS